MVHVNIHIIGRVQGVGFRYTALSVARMYNIKGFVKNMPDNSVYIEAEGETNNMDDFIKWCHDGPPRAKVINVIVTQGELVGFSEFQVGR